MHNIWVDIDASISPSFRGNTTQAMENCLVHYYIDDQRIDRVPVLGARAQFGFYGIADAIGLGSAQHRALLQRGANISIGFEIDRHLADARVDVPIVVSAIRARLELSTLALAAPPTPTVAWRTVSRVTPPATTPPTSSTSESAPPTPPPQRYIAVPNLPSRFSLFRHAQRSTPVRCGAPACCWFALTVLAGV